MKWYTKVDVSTVIFQVYQYCLQMPAQECGMDYSDLDSEEKAVEAAFEKMQVFSENARCPVRTPKKVFR